jgi:hypothetical protein
MKKITIYECEDGKRFNNKEDAKQYDGILFNVMVIMSPLGEAVTKQFSAKEQNVLTTIKAFGKLMELCAKVIPTYKETFENTTLSKAYDSLAYRVLSDFSNDYPCVYKAYHRFTCISTKTFIEYEQPYWTKHENEYKQKYNEFKAKMMKFINN